MEDSPLLADLNPVQREAVAHPGGPLLIVAGAGSGKTRVLTHRVAWLIRELGVSPFEILAITFTNKAADEMKSRVAALVGPVAQKMWVSTFHSACVRILRRDARRLGYRSTFTIYDQADSERLTGYVLRDLNLDPKRFPPRAVHAVISQAKNDLVVLLAKEHHDIAVVGDSDQCLPPETQIATPEGPKRIEEVSVGDAVLGTGARGRLLPGRVTHVQRGVYMGPLYTVRTADRA